MRASFRVNGGWGAQIDVTAAEHTETMMELATCGSLEMNADRAGDARTIADLLPSGTKVYVNHLPRNALSETQRITRADSARLLSVE